MAAGRRVIRALKWSAGIVAVALVPAQFIGPTRSNPPVDPALALEASVPVPPEVLAILDRACADCHSHRTRWPWYSYVAPVRWLVAGDVDHARRHLNFSVWSRPADPGRRSKPIQEKLDEICEEVKSGAMPLPSYLLLHPRARLTAAERRALCEWSAQAGRPEGRPTAPEERGGS